MEQFVKRAILCCGLLLFGQKALTNSTCDVFPEELTDLTELLDRRHIHYTKLDSYILVHPNENGPPLEKLAWWTKQMLNTDLLLLSRLTYEGDLEQDTVFVVYWPKILIKLCDDLKFEDLKNLIWNDLRSRRPRL